MVLLSVLRRVSSTVGMSARESPVAYDNLHFLPTVPMESVILSSKSQETFLSLPSVRCTSFKDVCFSLGPPGNLYLPVDS
jgi:hypothetical protein